MGCGGSSESKGYPVTGVVKYKGVALNGGTVVFTEAGKRDRDSRYTAIIDQEGNYSMKNVPAGDMKIFVLGPTPSSDTNKPRTVVKLPDKYKDPEKSGLTYTVVQGPQEHNIDLN